MKNLNEWSVECQCKRQKTGHLLIVDPANVFRSGVRHSVYPSVCRTDGYGTDRRLQEHALFRAKNVLYSFSSKAVRFECIVISALHVHLLSSKTP